MTILIQHDTHHLGAVLQAYLHLFLTSMIVMDRCLSRRTMTSLQCRWHTTPSLSTWTAWNPISARCMWSPTIDTIHLVSHDVVQVKQTAPLHHQHMHVDACAPLCSSVPCLLARAYAGLARPCRSRVQYSGTTVQVTAWEVRYGTGGAKDRFRNSLTRGLDGALVYSNPRGTLQLVTQEHLRRQPKEEFGWQLPGETSWEVRALPSPQSSPNPCYCAGLRDRCGHTSNMVGISCRSRSRCSGAGSVLRMFVYSKGSSSARLHDPSSQAPAAAVPQYLFHHSLAVPLVCLYYL